MMPQKKIELNETTREAWLESAIEIFRTELFKRNGFKVPSNIRVSVGLPGGSRNSKKAIGQCWNSKATIDNYISIFISPVLDDSARVLDVLAHELVHAVLDCKGGHGPQFRRIAIAVGLEGPMRSTHAGMELASYIKGMISQLGNIPHARLNLLMNPVKKQTTRMVKMECEECGYIARASRKYIDERGAVICPCNGSAMHL